MEKAEVSRWERSKISNQDQKMLKKHGLLKKQDSLKFPGDESFPRPPIEFWVTFTDHLIRGLSTPIHEFLCGLLFIYGIQLHQLTPISILHISIFITLCECFLEIHPHWGMWKRIFSLRRNNFPNVVYNVGGVCICVRPNVDYFDVKFPDSVQGWRKRWLYIQDEYIPPQEYGIMPFEAAEENQRRRSWDTEATAEEKAATEALMNRIHQLQNTDREELWGVQLTAYFLRIRVQSLTEGRSEEEEPAAHALGEGLINVATQFIGFRDEVDTLREALCRAEERVDALEAKLKSSETVMRVDVHVRWEPQEEGVEDRLLDTLSILELNGDLARTNISNARTAFKRIFPHFFPKETQPEIFSELVQRFLGKEDPALAHRQDSLKIGVEGTIALVAASE
ncbi:hypothetical protein QYE76_041915 [Lolium multiflorum]|uniref:Transposase (putative) gypsy type domain-containing protein n=1 Tax=Lolium multiflorum TaxID=4521 RepID=A0AAD8TFW7_LOLMU|nr:hypothetical protein QYE76_041915 [Lolium multiflorum]